MNINESTDAKKTATTIANY